MNHNFPKILSRNDIIYIRLLSVYSYISGSAAKFQMNNQRKRKRESSQTNYKRLKPKSVVSIERVRELVNSEKGEAVQALYSIFHSNSISFDTLKHVGPSAGFVTFLNVAGYCFIGFGCKKITSRAAASKAALVFFVDNSHPSEYTEFNPVAQRLVADESVASTPLSLPDYVATLVVSKYERLRREHSLPWFKMIAGIVSVEDEDVGNARVIVLATGSKCIEPANVRHDGLVIFDSHAETLIRRSFQYFLYTQLSTAAGSKETIVEKNGSKSRIKPGVRLYLFVNSAPCGDSRIFTVSDKNSSRDKHPNRISRGVLRIKLDGGNSTVPLANFEKYDPERLMIMSCSDKLLKSNALGLQGSLLSNVVEPVYLDGIVIGNSFSESHVTRALYERLADVTLPSPFRLHQPTISGLEKNLNTISKSPKTCVNWHRRGLPEITDSTTGRTMSGQSSRLCKRNLFERYLKLRSRSEDTHSYADCKRECSEYQMAKKCFHQNLQSRGLGKWIERVPSFDAFKIENHKSM